MLGDRQRARTDLLFLCNQVLQYKDVCAEVHGPIIERLQTFRGGVDHVRNVTRQGGVLLEYEPACGLWELAGLRRRLILDPRGHLKTTVITQAHTIQWIINYPDVRILLSMATGEQVRKVVTGILGHFRFNEIFRFLFPEFCPSAKGAADFGNLEGFTVPCRKNKWTREATVSICTVGKVIAGSHYEVIKHSDLVDKDNIKTPNQIAEVAEHFKYTNPLLERRRSEGRDETSGWIDVEGTRYDFSDLYGQIIDDQEKLPEDQRYWLIHERSAEVDPEKEIPLWPEFFPWKELMRIKREMGDFLYSTQYLQKPIPQGSGLAMREEIRFAQRRLLMAHTPRLHMTVDMAGMDEQQKQTGDFVAFAVAGFDRDGRMNVVDARVGRYSIDEVIEMLFGLCKIFPSIADVKVEKEAHWRTLKPFMLREQHKRGFLPPVIDIKRDNRTSKKHRIKALQPYFKAGLIRFAEEIPCRLELIQQITRFSDTSTYHDDILDTLADQLQNRDGGVIADAIPGQPKGADGPLPFKLGGFLGFTPWGEEIWQDAGGAFDTMVHEGTGL